jgi:inosine-uridine nucleoside N-ribohydrolase
MSPARALLAALFCLTAAQAQKRLVLIDQDGAGPAGSNQQAMLVLLESKQTEVLGITIVQGDGMRDEEVRHTLRMLELTGHENIPMVAGAATPLVRTREETRLAEQLAGKVGWLGGWGQNGPSPFPEGEPHLKPLDEDAPHFLIRQVHAHPGDVTIFAAGPLTNIALAIAIDPTFAQSTKGIVLMGGSLNPATDDPEFATAPRHEFNFWFDPEATQIVLRAPWPRVDVTTVDVSIKAPFTKAIFDAVARGQSGAAKYIARYGKPESYLWDELAACAWLEPAIITKTRDLYMDVDLSHGIGWGDTLTWTEANRPATGVRLVHAQVDLDVARFTKLFTSLMTAQ